MTEQKASGERKPNRAQEDPHETARQLTEDALGAYAKGKEKQGDQLVDKAKQTDETAVQEVMEDLDDDAGSDHSVSPGNQ